MDFLLYFLIVVWYTLKNISSFEIAALSTAIACSWQIFLEALQS
jgi:hypothetical protein